MDTIGVGLIGWGFMGRTHTHALRSIPLFYPGADFRIRQVMVCSRRLEKAREAAETAGWERYTDDYRVLLADPEISVVSICTPNELHEQMAIEAIRAGKHVYIDKPLAVTAESADRIAAAAAQSDVKTCMVFNNRCTPAILRAKQLIEEGAIGNVLSFEARYLHSGSIDPRKPIGWKQQGQAGVLLDMGSHALDLVTWLVGYPSSVLCRLRTLYPTRPTRDGGTETALSDDHALMLLELPNGALGTVEASKIATGTTDEFLLELCGDRGAIKWNSMDPSYLYFYDNTQPEVPLGGVRGFTRIETVGRYPAPGGSFLPPKNAIGWDRGHVHCYYRFLEDIVKGRIPENDIAAGARLQRLMAALQESSRLGKWIKTEELI